MMHIPKLTAGELLEVKDAANRMRLEVVKVSAEIKTGYPSSCSSVIEILAIMFYRVLRYKVSIWKDLCNDRLVFSKGHACLALYAAFAEIGLFPKSELSEFMTKPIAEKMKYVDVGTGSPGHGLSYAAGMAYMAKYFDEVRMRVYCVMGDGETAEGSFWEAVNFCSHYRLDNLCLVVDTNGSGRSGPTLYGDDYQSYIMRFEAFGWNTIIVDGHNIGYLYQQFQIAAQTENKPTVIIARTTKGKNFLDVEDLNMGRNLGDKADIVLRFLQRLVRNPTDLLLSHCKPLDNAIPSVRLKDITMITPPEYESKVSVTTRAAFGLAVTKLAEKHPRIVVLDADCRNESYLKQFEEFDSKRFIECFSSEQNMIDVAVGMSSRGRCVVFCIAFATGVTKTFDCLRMAAICGSQINVVGIHAGVTSGETTGIMGVEDIAFFRTIPDSVIFYPSDAVAAERAAELAANYSGITYTRLTRPATPVFYPSTQEFQIGKANVIRANEKDEALVIAAGITVLTALHTYEELLNFDDIHVRVMDVFTIKPLDSAGIIEHAKVCEKKIVVVEDHLYEGGLGEAVKSIMADIDGITVKHIAVKSYAMNGNICEVLAEHQLAAAGIRQVVQDLIFTE